MIARRGMTSTIWKELFFFVFAAFVLVCECEFKYHTAVAVACGIVGEGK